MQCACPKTPSLLLRIHPVERSPRADGSAIAGKKGRTMKKTTRTPKLAIAKETLLQMGNPDLEKVAGNAWSDDSVCPTVSHRCG